MNKPSIPDDGPFRGRSTHEALSQLRTRARANAARSLRSPAAAAALTLTLGAVACAGVLAMAWIGTGDTEMVASASIEAPAPEAPAHVTLVSQRVEDQSGLRTDRDFLADTVKALSPLGTTNPRWGEQEGSAKEVAPGKLRALAKSHDAGTPAPEEEDALNALRGLTMDQDKLPPGANAYSPVDEPDPAVEIAETEAETAALEEKLEMAPSEIDTARTSAIPAAELSPARVTRYVNLRAGAADEATVLMVVPANAEIEAETDCGWCEVVYDGNRGFIYKSFIRHEDRQAAAD